MRTSAHPGHLFDHGPGVLRSKPLEPAPLLQQANTGGPAHPGVPPAPICKAPSACLAGSVAAVLVDLGKGVYSPTLLGLAGMEMCLSSFLRHDT